MLARQEKDQILTSRIIVYAEVLTTVLVLSGCMKQSTPGESTPIEQLQVLPYPSSAPVTADLDIVVRRDGGALMLVNRTARRFENVQIWLNQQHVGLVPRIAIGDANRFDLSSFINEYGEPYPIGGLLTPEKTFPIVLAEMFDPGAPARYRLLVRTGKK